MSSRGNSPICSISARILTLFQSRDRNEASAAERF